MNKNNLSIILPNVKRAAPIKDILPNQKKALIKCNQTVILEAALSYAQAGLPIFPCSPVDKSPLVKWTKDATTDQETIKKWWQKNPNALIGLPTGQSSGLFVLDLDEGQREDGTVKTGIANFDALCAENNCTVPETFTTTTAHEGKHLYFKMPEGDDIRNSTGKLAQYADVRGNGGYVIAAPGVMDDGKTYNVESKDNSISEAPQWLIELLTENKESNNTNNDNNRCEYNINSSSKISFNDLIPKIQKIIKDQCNKIREYEEGSVNNQLNKSALIIGHYVPKYIPRVLAEYMLESAAKLNGYTERDGIKAVLATINSGIEKGMSEPQELSTSDNITSEDGSSKTYILPKPPKVPIHVLLAPENMSATA